MIKAQRGTIDILPSEVNKWQYLEEKVREICSVHNVKEIRTPLFEATELFSRSSGESSDIVNKEMYTFLDKGDRSITLKPEGTAGVVRACVEHGFFADSMPLKLFYISPAYRYEKPQSGRLREFRQFGVENFGSNSPKMIAETISIGYDFLNKIGVKNVKISLNNIGCSECRKNYTEKLKSYFESKTELLCEDCKRRLNQNPLRILDCKVESCREVISGAPKIDETLCDDCKLFTSNLINYLKQLNIPYELDTSVIRGLDYYTGIVFEFITSDIEGSSAVIGGGGQYNNLVKELGGPEIPAVGFAFGMERLLMLLDKQKKVFENEKNVDVFVINQNKEFEKTEMEILAKLRDNGVVAETDYMDRSFRASFKYADKIKAKYLVILGEDEMKQNSVSFKNMETGEQKVIKIDNILENLK